MTTKARRTARGKYSHGIRSKCIRCGEDHRSVAYEVCHRCRGNEKDKPAAEIFEQSFEPQSTVQDVKMFIDPYLILCEYCALPDCVRLEGEIQTARVGNNKRRVGGYKITDCAVTQAERRGWDADTALANWHELKLFEPEFWKSE